MKSMARVVSLSLYIYIYIYICMYGRRRMSITSQQCKLLVNMFRVIWEFTRSADRVMQTEEHQIGSQFADCSVICRLRLQ